MNLLILLIQLASLAISSPLWAQTQRVVDIPTRPGVTQRMVVLGVEKPRASVVLLAGGHGGLQITSSGSFKWGEKNFVVRSRQLFASQGWAVAVIDAPSDRQSRPHLGGFRQQPEHVADIKAVIAWLKQQAAIPVWLVGTSRGTQSAAFIATQLSPADSTATRTTSSIPCRTRSAARRWWKRSPKSPSPLRPVAASAWTTPGVPARRTG